MHPRLYLCTLTFYTCHHFHPYHAASGADLCPVCKLVVEAMENYLKENRTAAELDKFLRELCDFLPDTVTAQVL